MATRKATSGRKRTSVRKKAAPKKGKTVVAHATESTIVNGDIAQKKGKSQVIKGEPAQVRVSMGTTLNMGNYQSLRLGVDIALPCSVTKIDAAFAKATKFVESKLDSLVRKHQPTSPDETVEDIVL